MKNKLLIAGILSASALPIAAKPKVSEAPQAPAYVTQAIYNAIEPESVATPVKSSVRSLSTLSSDPTTTPMLNLSTLALNRAKVNETITPETTELFGERIDLNTGSVSFQTADVSIPGNNGLPVAIHRSFRDHVYDRADSPSFGDWQLSIPAISTNLIDLWGSGFTGSWGQGKACSGPLNPGSYDSVDVHIHANTYWNGDNLDIPGVFSGRLLEPTSGTGRVLRGWKFSCIATSFGEGFIATNADGVSYRFDKLRLVKKLGMPLVVSGETMNGESSSYEFTKYVAFLQVSEITDRFGNWVRYNYDASNVAKLTSITASDGRAITLNYETGVQGQRIQSVVANGKTWTYQYGPTNSGFDTLKKVIRPDGLAWEFEMSALNTSGSPFASTGDQLSSEALIPQRTDYQCVPQPFTGGPVYSTSPGDRSYYQVERSYIRHPNGAKLSLALQPTLFGRTNVAKTLDTANTQAKRHLLDRCYAGMAIYSKTITFPDQQTYRWQYRFSENAGSYVTTKSTEDGTDYSGPIKPQALTGYSVLPTGYSAMDLRSTTVIAPDGSKTLHLFDRKFGSATEGLEVAREQFDTNGYTLLQTSRTEYKVTANGASPKMQAIVPGRYNTMGTTSFDFDNEAPHANYADVSKVTTVNYVNGASADIYTTAYSDFTATGKPKLTQESNNFNGKVKYTRQLFSSDTNLWVLDVPTQQEVSADNSSYTITQKLELNSMMLPAKVHQFGVHILTNSFNADGTLAQQQYTLNNRWVRYENYYRGQPQRIKLPSRYTSNCNDPLGACYSQLTMTVNADGTIAQATDLNGNSTSYTYDAMQRLTGIYPVTPWNATTIQYLYNSDGSNFQQVVSRGNYKKTINLDALMRPVLQTEQDLANGALTRYVRKTFNAYGKETFASVASNNSNETFGVTSNYDGLQRVVSQTNTPQGNISHSYLAGNKVATTNGRGYTTTTQYLAYGKASQELATLISAPLGVTTSIAYNIFDNPTSISQGGITETRGYNPQQQLCIVKRPETGIRVLTYNNLGQVASVQEDLGDVASPNLNNPCVNYQVLSASFSSNFTYDNLGAEWSQTYSDGLTAGKTATLDAQGNLLALVSGTNQWSYQYNSANLLTQETFALDGKTWTFKYGYNANGHMQSVQYPNNLTVALTPNSFGQIEQAQANGINLAAAVRYYPNDQLQSFTYGSGQTFSQTLDGEFRPYERRVSLGSATQLMQRYSYDVTGNVTQIADVVSTSKSLQMSYDALDRLKTVTGGYGNLGFNYDVLGNITSKTINTTTHTYSYNNLNRLVSLPGFSLSYDSRGNVLGNGRRTFGFNKANQLVSSGNISYQYDGHGRRVKQLKAGVPSYTLYNQAGQLLWRGTDSNNGVASVYLGKQFLAEIDAPSQAVRYQHTDVLGSVIGESAASGSLLKAYDYKPFGEGSPTQKTGVGYTGHLEDTDLGLTYMQQRYYDPVIGRFYSNDPVDMLGHMQRGNPTMGFNRYAYGNNNPYKYVDPDGEYIVPLIVAAVAIATIAVMEVKEAFDNAASQVIKDMDRAEAINEKFKNGEFEAGYKAIAQDDVAFENEVLPAVANFAETASKSIPGTSMSGPVMTGINDVPSPSSVVIDEVIKEPIKDEVFDK